jgi:trigger factor
LEIEILETLINDSEFAEIPEVMLEAEKQKIFYELTHDLEKHGITIDQYLIDLKKTQEELARDFTGQAEKRAKAALISRQVAADNHIHIHDEELDKEVKFLEDMYKDNKEYLENLKRPEVRDTIAMTLQNKKVMQWLKAKVLGEEVPEGIVHEHK